MHRMSHKFFKNIGTLFLFSILAVLTPVQADDNNINGTCPGEIIGEIDQTTTDASHTENGSIGGGGNDRYRMTFPSAGTLNISVTNRNASRNANYYFYLSKNSCGNNDTDWNVVSGEYGRSHSHLLSVNAGDTVYIRLQSISREPNRGRHSYALALDYTSNAQNTSGSTMPFELINPDYSRNLIGDYRIAGNTVLCLTEKTDGYGGTCQGDNSSYQTQTSNNRVSKYLDIDDDNGTWDSTSSNINFPNTYDPNRGVIWAGLFWQGRIAWDTRYDIRYAQSSGSNSFTSIEPEGSSVTVANTQAPDIKLKVDEGSYNDVRADTFHTYASSNGQTYAAYADVTAAVQSANLNAGLHRFTVANLTTMEGREPSPGAFGGWALVVIFGEDYNLGSPRNISIYNGFISISGSNAPITISGFKLPSNNTVTSQLSVFSGEGEYRYGRRPGVTYSDWMKISDSDDASSYAYMPGKPAGTALGNRDNMFDAQLDGILRDHINGKYNDQSVNNVGIDVDTYDVSDLMTQYRTANSNIDTVYIKLYSNQDYITTSMMAFSAELYVPELCYDYTLDIGGYVLTSTDNRVDTPFGAFGLPLTTKVYIRSLEGDLNLNDVNVTYQINNTNQLQYTYNNCSTEISENGFYNYEDACPYTVAAGSSGFSMYIGDGKSSSRGGIIGALQERYIKFDSDFKTANVNTAFTFGINYTVDYGSGAVPLHKDFNASNLCPSSGGGFQPDYSIFNVIDGSASYDRYNLYTQVSGRPFTLQVYAYDKTDPVQPVSDDLNTTVEVELIRADNFAREADVACNDPYSIISGTTGKFVSINVAKNGFATFDKNETNFAYRNVAARVWYLTRDDGSLVQDHNCTRANQQACVDLYGRDFSDAHECDTQCASGGSGCYDCIRSYHGKKACSRDNFAIRPEAFVTQLIDSNQSTDITKPSNLVTDSRSGAVNSGNVVAGYRYRFDVNATNHMNDTPTDQYRAYFFNGLGGRKAQMIWYPNGHTVSNCNDVSDKNITLALFDGSSVNYHTKISVTDQVEQIGQYQFIIEDQNWTSADWDPAQLVHHTGTYAGHFTGPNDCEFNTDTVLSSATSTSSNNKNGCTISSVHTNPDTGAAYTYLDMRFHPYMFDVSGLAVGLRPSQTAPTAPNNFVYMNTPGANDQNMSYNIYGTYKAAGYTGGEVSNFVKDCYAVDTNMTLNQTTAYTTMMLSYDIKDHNTSNPSVVIRAHEQGTFDEGPHDIVQGQEYYAPDMKGAITMDLGYNYARTVNTPVNPQYVRFSDFNITYVTNPNISVDLVNYHKIAGSLSLDDNITFLYGRTHAPRYRVECSGSGPCSTTTSPNQPLKIYEEFYYDLGATIDSNATLTPFSNGGQRSIDAINWYTNTLHQDSDGNVSSVVQYYNGTQVTSSPITTTTPTANASGVSTTDATYDGQSYPYKATMGLITSPWLVYNRFDASADHNEFDLEFNAAQIGGDPTKSDSNLTSPNTSRRIQW